jgi:hypothetical protein
VSVCVFEFVCAGVCMCVRGFTCMCVGVCVCVCKRAHFCLKVSYSTKNEMQQLHL